MLRDLGINKDQLKRWEEPGAVIKPIYVNAIADYLGTTPEYLLGQTDEKQKAPTPTRSECEEKILQHFRELSPEGQQALIKVVESMKKSSDKAQ